MHDNVIAATVAFDHFTRELARPSRAALQARRRAFNDPVLHSATDPDDFGPANGLSGQTPVVDPQRLDRVTCATSASAATRSRTRCPTTTATTTSSTSRTPGSYYDKINTAILLAESEDRFISQSRRDFYDARFRAVGMADIVPDGFRRVIANALTGDRSLLAPHLVADADRQAGPRPTRPIRAIRWQGLYPKVAARLDQLLADRPARRSASPTDGRNACTNFAGDGGLRARWRPANTVAVDPQIGWEVQKFLIAWTVAYIQANEQDQLDRHDAHLAAGPERRRPTSRRASSGRIPTSGETYYARTFGTECLFGDAQEQLRGRQDRPEGDRRPRARVRQPADRRRLQAGRQPATQPTAGRAAGFNAVRAGDGSAPARRDADREGRPGDPQHHAPRGACPRSADCDQNVTPGCTPLTVDQNHFAVELQALQVGPRLPLGDRGRLRLDQRRGRTRRVLEPMRRLPVLLPVALGAMFVGSVADAHDGRSGPVGPSGPGGAGRRPAASAPRRDRGRPLAWQHPPVRSVGDDPDVGRGGTIRATIPTYEWWIALKPQLTVFDRGRDALTLNLWLNAYLELTNSDTTTREHELLLGPTYLWASYGRVLRDRGGYRTSVSSGPRATLPTDKAAFDAGEILGLGAVGGAGQAFPLGGPGARAVHGRPARGRRDLHACLRSVHLGG